MARQSAVEEGVARRPGAMAAFEDAVEFAHGEGREGTGKAGGCPRGEDQFGGIGKGARIAIGCPAARAKADRQAMFGLDHLGRAVEVEALRMALEIGDGDEQVERMPGGEQGRAALRRRHRIERIHQHARENLPAKGRLEPARADEAGEFVPHLLARIGRDSALDRVAGAARRHPHERGGPEFGERAGGAGVGVKQPIDVGIVEPHVGQRIERLAGFDRLGQENAIDAACARPAMMSGMTRRRMPALASISSNICR